MKESIVKQRLYYLFKHCISFLIVKLYPLENWYTKAYQITAFFAGLQKTSKSLITGTFGIKHALLLNGILSQLTRTRIPFPIDMQASGLEIFTMDAPNGMIICSLHLPLNKVALRHLIDTGFPPTVAIVGNPKVKDSIAVWGITERIPAIRRGPFVLTKAKSILKQGGSVVALVDEWLGKDMSPNLFVLANKLKARVVYFHAKLKADGIIEVWFEEANCYEGEATDVINSQIMQLQQQSERILNAYAQLRY